MEAITSYRDSLGSEEAVDQVNFSLSEGEVIDYKSEFETHVHSSGGGGYVGKHGGYVASAEVSSSSTHHKKIWIKTSDNSEKCLDLTLFDIEVREGHKLTLLYGTVKSSEFKYLAGVKNQSTGEVSVPDNLLELFSNSKVLTEGISGREVWGGVGIGCVLAALTAFTTGPLFPILGAFMGRLNANKKDKVLLENFSDYQNKVKNKLSFL